MKAKLKDLISIYLSGGVFTLKSLDKEIEFTEVEIDRLRQYSRPEAQEKINKVFGEECPYQDGQLIAVRDNEKTDYWQLLPSTGKFKLGKAETYLWKTDKEAKATWKFHAPAHNVKLPE